VCTETLSQTAAQRNQFRAYINQIAWPLLARDSAAGRAVLVQRTPRLKSATLPAIKPKYSSIYCAASRLHLAEQAGGKPCSEINTHTVRSYTLYRRWRRVKQYFTGRRE